MPKRKKAAKGATTGMPGTPDLPTMLLHTEKQVRRAQALHQEATQRLGEWAVNELTGSLSAQGHDLRTKARATHRDLIQLENNLAELRRLVTRTPPTA